MTELRFYNASAPNYAFANVSPVKILVNFLNREGNNATWYACSEAFYQASKVFKFNYVEKYSGNLRSSDDAWNLVERMLSGEITGSALQKQGTTITNKAFKRNDTVPVGENLSEKLMADLINMKLTQYPSLIKLLNDNDPESIFEDSPYDNFWGIGAHGNGRNALGILIYQEWKKLQGSFDRGETVKVRYGFSQKVCEGLEIPYNPELEFYLDGKFLNLSPDILVTDFGGNIQDMSNLPPDITTFVAQIDNSKLEKLGIIAHPPLIEHKVDYYLSDVAAVGDRDQDDHTKDAAELIGKLKIDS